MIHILERETSISYITLFHFTDTCLNHSVSLRCRSMSGWNRSRLKEIQASCRGLMGWRLRSQHDKRPLCRCYFFTRRSSRSKRSERERERRWKGIKAAEWSVFFLSECLYWDDPTLRCFFFFFLAVGGRFRNLWMGAGHICKMSEYVLRLELKHWLLAINGTLLTVT